MLQELDSDAVDAAVAGYATVDAADAFSMA